mgnify:FL=1
MQKIKNSLLFLIVLLSNLTISCNRYPIYTYTSYCNSVNTNKDEIELTTIYRNRLSSVEVESVKLDTIRLYDSIGGVWKLETYLVDSITMTNFEYRLLIDDEDDFNTVSVLNTDSYCIKIQEK